MCYILNLITNEGTLQQLLISSNIVDNEYSLCRNSFVPHDFFHLNCKIQN